MPRFSASRSRPSASSAPFRSTTRMLKRKASAMGSAASCSAVSATPPVFAIHSASAAWKSLWSTSISAAARAACSGTGTKALRIGFGNARSSSVIVSIRHPGIGVAKSAGVAVASSGRGNVTVMPSRALPGSKMYSSGSSLPASRILSGWLIAVTSGTSRRMRSLRDICSAPVGCGPRSHFSSVAVECTLGGRRCR